MVISSNQYNQGSQILKTGRVTHPQSGGGLDVFCGREWGVSLIILLLIFSIIAHTCRRKYFLLQKSLVGKNIQCKPMRPETVWLLIFLLISENPLNCFKNCKTQLFNSGGVVKWAYFQKKWSFLVFAWIRLQSLFSGTTPKSKSLFHFTAGDSVVTGDCRLNLSRSAIKLIS